MGELLVSDKPQLNNWQQSQTILCSKEDYGEFIVTFLFSSQVDHISSYAHNTIILVYFSITPNGWRLNRLLGVRLQALMLDIRSHQNRAKLQFFCPIRSFV
jgi:hypothetical protein